MELCKFTRSETGTDLIVSFACGELDPDLIRSITLLRTPKYEVFLYPRARRPRV